MSTHLENSKTASAQDLLKTRLTMLSPVRPWMKSVTRDTVQADLFAALTNAAIVLPQGVAFAIVAGLPPEYGLFTAMITSIIAGFWGSSMIMVSGPTTAISAVLFATIAPLAAPGTASFVTMALTLTIMVGTVQVLAGFARLGGLISFISHSVIVGFTAAAALLIAASQIGAALGISTERGGGIIERLLRVWHAQDQLNITAVVIAGLSLGTIVLCRRIHSKIPSYLVALVVGGVAGIVLDAKGAGIAMFGALPSVIPSFQPPTPSLSDIGALMPGAIAIAIVGLLEAISIGRAYATRRGEVYDSNQEIVGQGLSNLAGGFFQAYAGSGSFTRSGLNAESGARTPMSAIFAAGWLLIMLIVVAPLVIYIPVPAMAGIILYVAWRLIDMKEIRHIFHSKAETSILLATFLAGVVVELEFSIVVGVVLSLIVFLYKSSHPFVGVGAPTVIDGRRCFRHAACNNLKQCPKIVVKRIQGAIFFASVEELQRDFLRIEEDNPGQIIQVLNVKGVGTLDLAGADFLVEQIQRARARGGDFFISTGFPAFIRAMDRYGVTEVLGPDNLVPDKSVGIRSAIAALAPQECANCTARVFLECADRPDNRRDTKRPYVAADTGHMNVGELQSPAPITRRALVD